MAKNDGGPAFPVEPSERYPDVNGNWVGGDDGSSGMTLRDWFAGQALNGLLSEPHAPLPQNVLANAAYLMADAMLAEREK